MKIKSVEDFSLEECREYLNTHPAGSERTVVEARLNTILQQKKYSEEQKKEQKRLEQERLTQDVKWIDIKRFISENRYKKLSGIMMILALVGILASLLFVSSIYYTCTPHKIYSYVASEQVAYTSGLERLLLEMDFIEPDFFDRKMDYPQYTNYEGDNCFGIPFLIILATTLLLCIIGIFHSPSLPNIYNIEQEEKTKSVRRTQNRKGRFGLYLCKKRRILQLLPMEYDNIYYCGGNAYVCVRGNKSGVYNAQTKKMVINIEYDTIEIAQNGALIVSKNGVHSKLTTDGYRIIE